MEKPVTKIAIQDCSYIVTALCCQLCDNLVTKLGQPCNKSDISVKLVTSCRSTGCSNLVINEEEQCEYSLLSGC